jgi:hypothetical protein
MRPIFWEIADDPRFDYDKHYEFPIYDAAGNVVGGDRLTEEGTRLYQKMLRENLKDWTNEVKWLPSVLQGKYIVAVAPDTVRHAMERSEARPTLFLANYHALCGAEHKEYEWSLMTNTTSTTLYQTGVVTCDYCLGILMFSED